MRLFNAGEISYKFFTVERKIYINVKNNNCSKIMWLIINDKLNDEQNLLSIGKCLLLCQKFESTCKNFVMMISLAKKVTIDKEFSFMSDEHQNHVDKLLNLFLGESINYYKKNFKEIVPENEIECLKKAKYARNYICHDATIDFVYSSIYSEKKYNWNISILKEHVSAIATADYYVSRWTFEFQEREPDRFSDKNEYVDNIINWIFK